MKRIKITLILLTVAFFSISCSSNDSEETDPQVTLAFQKLTNVSYGTDAKQNFDLYLPEGRTSSTKVMILVHGGGWSSGDKSSMDVLVNLFRTDLPNIALVNINYRLSDENNPPYPMQINDITSIINLLKANKEEYAISEDFGFLGTSAGGHLSLLWSYAFDSSNDVNMVCSIVGPTNFTDEAYLNNTNPALQLLLDSFGLDPTIEFLEEVSPLHQATSSSPPTIHFYGGQDPLIPTTQGTGLRDQLNTLGVTNEFTLYENAGHGWGANAVELTLLLDTWAKIKAFTETHL